MDRHEVYRLLDDLELDCFQSLCKAYPALGCYLLGEAIRERESLQVQNAFKDCFDLRGYRHDE